jgi:hypothetical protein
MTMKNINDTQALDVSETEALISLNELLFNKGLCNLFNKCSRGDLETKRAQAIIENLKLNGLGQETCNAGSIIDDYDLEPLDEVIARLDADITVRTKVNGSYQIHVNDPAQKISSDEFYKKLCALSKERFDGLADIFERCNYSGEVEQILMRETIRTLFLPDHMIRIMWSYDDITNDDAITRARCKILIRALRTFDHS